ncbi:small ribosomal subunit biogenesis GTPase RsgA [Gilvimarinus sp. SDUM040013]|uniref:Small ribosomal subunit biogenesis GTPase RsgA n=1 Tax=Gilvimarinus gilvus TaxID=3058038 RepID=A0ABU4S093_9GAMM|nr:small ribosomal subunit biogenesis GTPase RsgA [Gilvimarinus sp. SDUM040013]MDO3387359.1 small ribosomal subunit biogenesis GTPase RsgA [Gilvimarinus sp. SDUM040013]MDX6849836.1 small ribosomal subunit biogenesis GTPase RsgA [Gilvimarinus sp. SDUM040013]
MSKRKLTRRQSWRIEKIQKEREKRASRRDDKADEKLGESDLGQEQEGLIVTHYGTQVMVEDAATREAKRCHFRSNLGGLVTGDKVIWRDGNPFGVVVARIDRATSLMRPDPYGDMKAVAANIDRIAIVVAPYPEPHFNLIDRYLVAAEAIGIEPALVINKVDLIDDQQRDKVANIQALYTSLGYTVILASATQDHGLEPLRDYLSHFTSVFVGQSGVGKSSLVNALLPKANIRVGELSERQTGTHTTTNATLYDIPSGGRLIDSPGIREFGLWHVEPEDVLAGFKEFRPFMGGCKFRDCSHSHEPGCAILQALDDGKITEGRLDGYRRILADMHPNR